MDGAPYGTVIHEGLRKPFMFLLGDHGDELDSMSAKIKSNIETIYNSWPSEHYWITIQGAKHFNFSDRPLQSEVLMSRVSGATGSIGGDRGLEVASTCLRTFFAVHLKGQPPTLIHKLPSDYPEARLER